MEEGDRDKDALLRPLGGGRDVLSPPKRGAAPTKSDLIKCDEHRYAISAREDCCPDGNI